MTLRNMIEEGNNQFEFIDETSKDLPEFLVKEIEFKQNQKQKNEIIEFETTATEAINSIYEQ